MPYALRMYSSLESRFPFIYFHTREQWEASGGKTWNVSKVLKKIGLCNNQIASVAGRFLRDAITLGYLMYHLAVTVLWAFNTFPLDLKNTAIIIFFTYRDLITATGLPLFSKSQTFF